MKTTANTSLLVVLGVLYSMASSAITHDAIPQRSYSNVIELNISEDCDITSAFTEAGADITNVAAYDKIVKNGSGTLSANVDLSAFTGDIVIKAGKLDVSVAAGLGAASTESFVAVESGATLQLSACVVYNAKTVYFEGNGCAGASTSGALMTTDFGNNSTKITEDMVFVMTADAVTRVLCTSQSARLFGSSEMYMNSHTNVCYFGANGKAYYFHPVVKDQGVFDIRMGLVYIGSDISLPRGANGEIGEIICNGNKVNFNAEEFPDAFWKVRIADVPNNFWAHKKSITTIVWPGIFEIDEGQELVINDAVSLDVLGGFSGGGSFVFAGTGTNFVRNASSSFTGKMAVNSSTIQIATDHSFPNEVASIEMDNGLLDLAGGSEYSLPAISVLTDSRMSSEGAVSAAGLFAGYSSDLYPGGYEWSISNEWSKYLYFGDLPVLTNVLEVTDMQRLYKGVPLTPTAQETGRQVYMYSGYIMNNSDSDQVWAFSVNLKYNDYLVINGDEVFDSYNKANVQHVGTAVLHPGANTFLLRCYVNSSTVKAASGGPSSNAKDKNGDVLPGFAVIRNCGTKTEEELLAVVVADWEQVKGDPGDGSLFRVAKDDAELRSLMRAGLVGDGLSQTTIRKLSIAADASFDLAGRDVMVEEIENFATVVNRSALVGGNELCVSGWTISADDFGLSDSDRMDVDCRLRFSDGAKLNLPKSLKIQGGVDIEIARSSVGIVGLPTPQIDGKAIGWLSVSLSPDGKSLRLKRKKGLILIVF